MTEYEAYALGYVYGTCERQFSGAGVTFGSGVNAGMRPFSSMAEAVRRLHDEDLDRPGVNARIQEALEWVESLPERDGALERVIPLTLQGSWDIGRTHGRAGVPMTEPTVRQLRQRAGMTQADLATALGVTQSAVSQWESGSAPAPDVYQRIKALTKR